MKIVTVTRKVYGPDFTLGTLQFDDFSCLTLEDKTRKPGVKVDKMTAISAGTYDLVVDMSARFNCDMPHILNVPMFEGIRIHKGNYVSNTEGCILLGTYADIGAQSLAMMVTSSTIAFDTFFAKLVETLKTQQVQIEIIDTYDEK